MNKIVVAKLSLLISLAVFSFHISNVTKKELQTTNIAIAGLVVSSETLSPIESAKIYDSANNLLGATDKNGYFNVNIKVNHTKGSELFFKLKIKKQGYQVFNQHEHWANMDRKSIMYFGLSTTKSNTKSFSKLVYNSNGISNLSYDNVLVHFKEVRAEKEFNNKLEIAKAGNENVLLQIDKEFYIVDKSGWIKINYGNDLISVNNKQVLTADKLNATIKRKDVKGMTSLDAKEEAKFAIFTR